MRTIQQQLSKETQVMLHTPGIGWQAYETGVGVVVTISNGKCAAHKQLGMCHAGTDSGRGRPYMAQADTQGDQLHSIPSDATALHASSSVNFTPQADVPIDCATLTYRL